MRFDGDIIITDPCYIMREDHMVDYRDDDWTRCNFGKNMEVLGIRTYFTRSTIYGDWGCTTFHLKEPLGKRSPQDLKEDDFHNAPLGQFCADAGLVSVFLLEEILRYNPGFDNHTKLPHAATLIKDFHGEVEDLVVGDEVFIVGTGNVNFITRQTGF